MRDTKATFINNYQPDTDDRVELKNGGFIDVVNGCFFDPGTSVILQSGKIQAVRPPADGPSGVTPDFTIDLGGRTVFPGLFNTHCHVSMTMPTSIPYLRDIRLSKKHHSRQVEKNMAECLAHGVTTVRDTWTQDLRLNRFLKRRISREEIPGPRIIQSVVVGPPNGYLSDIPNAVMRLTRSLIGMPFIEYDKEESGVVIFPVNANERQVRDAVDRAVDERGAECIKIGEQLENMYDFRPTATIMTIDQLKALTDQAHRRGLKTTIHHVSVASFRRAVEAGVSSLAHAAFDEKLTQADIEAFNTAGCIIEPTATVAYDLCWKLEDAPIRDNPKLERLSRFRDEVYRSLADEYWIPELSERVKLACDRLAAGNLKTLGILDMSKMLRYYSGVISLGTENIRLLFENGACIACGNDGGVPFCTPAMVRHELDMFDLGLRGKSEDGRLSGVDALKIATINSARALGFENTLGSIEVGKIADLAIVDGDPLEDVSLIGGSVAALFQNGRLTMDNCGLRIERGKR